MLITGFLLRYWYVLNGESISQNVWSDMAVYLRNAELISKDIWNPNHFFQSIGYPLLISGLSKISSKHLWVLNCLQGVASFITLYIVFKLTVESFGKTVGLWTLLICSLHVPWILYANYVLPELIFTMLLAVGGYCSLIICRSSQINFLASFVWGLSFTIALWLKGTHALWGPLFYCGLLWIKGKGSIKIMFFIGLIVSSGLAGHGYLTWKKINKVQLNSSTGGLNFIEGKCMAKKNTDSAGYTWLSPLYYQLGLNKEKVWNRPFTDSGYFFNQGLNCIKNDPLVLIQSFESIPYLFYGNHLWPFNQKRYERYIRFYDLIFALFVIVGITGYWINFKISKESKIEFVVWSIPIISLFLCVYIFKSELRYRVPFDIWFIPLGVKGWTLLIDKRRLS